MSTFRGKVRQAEEAWAVTDAQGTPSTLATLTFASTDPTIATVGPTNGRIQAVSAGTTTVVASSPGGTNVVLQVEVVP